MVQLHFTFSQKQKLLEIARIAIESILNEKINELNSDVLLDRIKLENKDPIFYVRAGVFVTLTISDDLRGCIGSLYAYDTIINSVFKNAINAGFEDPRFPRLTKKELNSLHIEISILTPLEKCKLSDIKIGDGVYIDYNGNTATFLPQVWNQLKTKDEFMSHLCSKAGLNHNFWKTHESNIQFSKYSVISFEEL